MAFSCCDLANSSQAAELSLDNYLTVICSELSLDNCLLRPGECAPCVCARGR